MQKIKSDYLLLAQDEFKQKNIRKLGKDDISYITSTDTTYIKAFIKF
jgi:hypothetical protein